jgi:hypothetical protein
LSIGEQFSRQSRAGQMPGPALRSFLRVDPLDGYVTVVRATALLVPVLVTVVLLSTSAALPASFSVSLVIAAVNIDVAPLHFAVFDGVPVAIAVPSVL